MYSKIDNHVSQALSRLTSEYQEVEFLRNIVEINASRIQIIEDAIFTLLENRWLDKAEGFQLDQIGVIVGEPRLGRSDLVYFEALQTRITLNVSGGEPERIIEYLVRVFGANDVRYKELYPAKIQVFVGTEISFGDVQNIRRIVPAGVGTIYIEQTDGRTPFGLNELTQPTPANIEGFNELGFHSLELDDGFLLELSDGDILGVTDRNDPIFSDEGGVFAELIEV